MSFSIIVFIYILLGCGVASCGKRDTPLDKDEPDPIAEERGFKNLGPQVKVNTVQGSAFASDDKGNLYIYTVVRGQTAHLVGVELDSKKAVVNLPLKGSDGSWDIKVSTDGILYVSSGQGRLYKHIPGTQQVTDLGKPLEGENYLWDLAVGKEGEIFGATYPGCRVFRYHPTDGFSDVANGPLVVGENYVRSIVYHEKTDMLYAGVGSHAHLVELNPRNGEKNEFLPAEYKDQEFVYNLSIIENGEDGDKLLIYLTGSGKTLVYNLMSKSFEGVTGINAMYVKSAINSSKEHIAYITAGSTLYEWDIKNMSFQTFASVNSNALATKFISDNTLVLFNSKKELVEVNTVSGKTEITQLDIPALPVRLNYVALGPENTIWSGGYLTGSNAAHDPGKGNTISYPGLSQTESMTFLGKNVYFGVYPRSRIYKFDSKKPWDISQGNPKLIGQIEGQDRPFGALAIGELNKVYFGTVPDYGKNGGALVEYNITMNKLNTYTNVVNNQSILSLVYSGGLLYGGSSNRGGLGINPTEHEAKMFIWDPVKNVKIKEIVPVSNAKSISNLTVGPDKKIWGIANGTIFIYDPDTDKVIKKHKLSNFTGAIGQWAPSAILFHPNGNVYVQDRANLYQIDPQTMKFDILEKSVNHLIMDDRGVLYFLKAEDLWQYIP